MNNKQRQKIGQNIVQTLKTFSLMKGLIYRIVSNHILLGVHLDGSSFSADTFYVYLFSMPLYVPSASLNLSYGFRLRRSTGDSWSLSENELCESLLRYIQSQGVAFFNSVDTPANLAKYCIEESLIGNARHQETIALSYCMSGDICSAMEWFDRIISTHDSNIKWEAEIASRAEKVIAAAKGSPEKAVQLLLSWERYTMQNLKLDN